MIDFIITVAAVGAAAAQTIWDLARGTGASEVSLSHSPEIDTAEQALEAAATPGRTTTTTTTTTTAAAPTSHPFVLQSSEYSDLDVSSSDSDAGVPSLPQTRRDVAASPRSHHFTWHASDYSDMDLGSSGSDSESDQRDKFGAVIPAEAAETGSAAALPAYKPSVTTFEGHSLSVSAEDRRAGDLISSMKNYLPLSDSSSDEELHHGRASLNSNKRFSGQSKRNRRSVKRKASVPSHSSKAVNPRRRRRRARYVLATDSSSPEELDPRPGLHSSNNHGSSSKRSRKDKASTQSPDSKAAELIRRLTEHVPVSDSSSEEDFSMGPGSLCSGAQSGGNDTKQVVLRRTAGPVRMPFLDLSKVRRQAKHTNKAQGLQAVSPDRVSGESCSPDEEGYESDYPSSRGSARTPDYDSDEEYPEEQGNPAIPLVRPSIVTRLALPGSTAEQPRFGGGSWSNRRTGGSAGDYEPTAESKLRTLSSSRGKENAGAQAALSTISKESPFSRALEGQASSRKASVPPLKLGKLEPRQLSARIADSDYSSEEENDRAPQKDSGKTKTGGYDKLGTPEPARSSIIAPPTPLLDLTRLSLLSSQEIDAPHHSQESGAKGGSKSNSSFNNAGHESEDSFTRSSSAVFSSDNENLDSDDQAWAAQKPSPPHAVPGLLSSLDFSNLRTGVEADEKLRKEEKLAKFKDECSEIHPGLFVGGLEVAKNKALLEQMGITHIVNCVTSLLPNQFPNDYCYLNYDFPDDGRENLQAMFKSVFAHIEAAKAGGGNTLIHCQQGVSRSASLALAYMMQQEEAPYTAALEVARSKRGIISPSLGFALQLRCWENELRAADKSLTDTRS